MSSSCRNIPLRITDRFLVERVARQHLASDDTRALLEEALAQLKRYERWSATFDRILKHAREGAAESLPDGFVWQDDLVEFWGPFTEIQRELLALYDSLAEVNPTGANAAERHLDPPEKAQIEYATEVTEFFDRDGYNRKQIAYVIRRLQAWQANFTTWLGSATRGLQALLSKL